MSNSILGIVLLILGISLLVYGFSASQSVASEFSELVHGAPSNKAIFLVIGGAILTAIGLVNVVRRRPNPS